jgi:hypothetical protein
MITLIQKRHLRAYTCPACGNPIGRIHAYPVETDTLLSRLTEAVPMHPTCAMKGLEIVAEAAFIVWTVKTSSPKQPSGRLFDRAEGDICIHLQTPTSIDFYLPSGIRPTYEQIRDIMLPAIRRARDAATSEEEIDEIARAIASLHRFLPNPPSPSHNVNTHPSS